MKRDADGIALLCQRVLEEVYVAYRKKGAEDKDYIELNLPKILFNEDQQKTDEFYDGLVEDKWWMKWYDRTWFIVKPDLWIGIKNNLSDEEQWIIINKYKEDV